MRFKRIILIILLTLIVMAAPMSAAVSACDNDCVCVTC
jgi:hypothetical protein